MKTIAIVNKSRSPELFEVLEGARTDGNMYEGCHVTKYEEYNTRVETIGLFTLHEANVEPSNFAA